MEKMNLAYCSECEDLVEFEIYNEIIEEKYRDEIVKFKFKIGRCKDCGHEVVCLGAKDSTAKYCRFVDRFIAESVEDLTV